MLMTEMTDTVILQADPSLSVHVRPGAAQSMQLSQHFQFRLQNFMHIAPYNLYLDI